jgi:hypothetical protein
MPNITCNELGSVYNLDMSLADLTRPAVLAAIEEHDRLGREDFLHRYGFGPARDYRLLFDGREYDSKAIAGGEESVSCSQRANLPLPRG